MSSREKDLWLRMFAICFILLFIKGGIGFMFVVFLYTLKEVVELRVYLNEKEIENIIAGQEQKRKIEELDKVIEERRKNRGL